MKIEDCAFCNRSDIEWRTIQTNDVVTSFVSSPSFREGHCVIIPNRHVATLAKLSMAESCGIIHEAGRLSDLLDTGNGSGMMQKYQPKQAENGIKMNHLHLHVFPRTDAESGLFPVPQPNAFDGFYIPERDAVIALVNYLKK